MSYRQWEAPEGVAPPGVEPEVRLEAALATPGPINILCLSGGGQNGAFGAGFLKGWRENPILPRPAFNVVTGVSTGALLATFAFLGEPEDDAVMERFYTTTSQRQVLSKRSDLALLFSNSRYTMEPLRRLLDRTITAEVIDRVQVEAQKGRQLLVATVDMDFGGVRVWDLTRLASEHGRGCVASYKKILLAAVAVPILVPPVFIDGRMHMDAGTREQVFIRRVFRELGQKRRVARALPSASSEPDRIYVIVNGKIGVPAECVDNCALPIALRSVQLLLDEALVGSLFRIHAFAEAEHMTFRVVRIPNDVPTDPDSHAFNVCTMRRLFCSGYELARAGYPWEAEPPTASDAERAMMRARAISGPSSRPTVESAPVR
jgi:predicted acylesterase/phospholipase RssA